MNKNLKMLQNRFIDKGITLEKGKVYKILRGIYGGWLIEYHKPRSTVNIFVSSDECEVIKENLFTKIKNKLSV